MVTPPPPFSLIYHNKHDEGYFRTFRTLKSQYERPMCYTKGPLFLNLKGF